MLIGQIVHQATTFFVPLLGALSCCLALFFLAFLRKRPSHTRPDDKILTVRDVAKLCGVKPRTVHKWFREGLPVSKIGRIKLVRRKDLDAFVDNHVTVSQ